MDKKAVYERIARFYDILDLPFEYGRYRRVRPLLFADLGSRILDAGVGTGRNIPFYPEGSEVIGIDLSPAMLARAVARRARSGRAVELFEMDVRRTSFPDDHFDGIVSSFLFCVLDDDQQLPALRELRRLCKPEGEIRLLEYNYPENPLQRFIMRLWAPWVRWAYGAAFDRNTEQYVSGAGLELKHKRFVYRDILKLLVLKPPS
ncbi:MAG: class I SAM-dependent methyltransferase [Alphaproteobacteria bacterium]